MQGHLVQLSVVEFFLLFLHGFVHVPGGKKIVSSELVLVNGLAVSVLFSGQVASRRFGHTNVALGKDVVLRSGDHLI